MSYPAVLAAMRKAENNWVENSALKEFERQGIVERIAFGDNIEIPLDYRPNAETSFLAADNDAATGLKTDIATAASFAIAQLSVPVSWSKGDDAKNPTENQKISLVKSILENGINSHDDAIERAIFTTTSTGGDEFLGLDSLVPTSGQGSPGGIAAATETWWRNPSDTYTDATDVEAAFTAMYNACMKGSGSMLTPTLLLSGSTPHALYESVLQVFQRFVDKNEGDGGFKSLAFKTAKYIFSQYGGDKVYFLNSKNYKLLVSKQYFRDKGNTLEDPLENMFRFKVYSALQAVVSNKSRLGVLDLA